MLYIMTPTDKILEAIIGKLPSIVEQEKPFLDNIQKKHKAQGKGVGLTKM